MFFSPSFSVDYKSYEITDTNLTKKEIIYFFPYLWGPLNPFSLATAVYSFPFCYASVLIIFRPLLLRLSAILCVPKSSFPIPIRSNRLEYPTTGINRGKVFGYSSDILNYISMPKKKLREKMHENVRYEKIYYAEIEEKRDNSWDSVLVNPGSGSTYVSPRSSPDIIKITLH